jgi:hypothetical protein
MFSPVKPATICLITRLPRIASAAGPLFPPGFARPIYQFT